MEGKANKLMIVYISMTLWCCMSYTWTGPKRITILQVAEIVSLREALSSSWQDAVDGQRTSYPDQDTQILMSAFSFS